MFHKYPNSKAHGANIGPIWGRPDPGGPHVGPMNYAIWVGFQNCKFMNTTHFFWGEYTFDNKSILPDGTKPLPRPSLTKVHDAIFLDSNFHGAHMGPTWVLSAPGGSQVGPMNLAIRDMVLLGHHELVPVLQRHHMKHWIAWVYWGKEAPTLRSISVNDIRTWTACEWHECNMSSELCVWCFVITCLGSGWFYQCPSG